LCNAVSLLSRGDSWPNRQRQGQLEQAEIDSCAHLPINQFSYYDLESKPEMNAPDAFDEDAAIPLGLM
jgi:hypothetical protein